MGRYKGYGTDVFVEGRRNEALDKRLTSLENDRQASTSNLVTAPEPCTPNFALAYIVIKGGLRGQFCTEVANNIQRLKTVIIKDSDVVDQASYESKRLNDETDVDDDSAAAGHFEYRFGPVLEHNTLYRLIRLVGIDTNGGRQINEAPLYTDTPLATFTTDAESGVIQAGGPNLINGGGMMNSVDQYTVHRGGVSVPADQEKLGAFWQTNVNSGLAINRTAGGTITSDGIQWLDTKAMLKHAYNIFTIGGRPATRIQKRIIPGETYTFSCLTACDAALQEQKLVVAFADQASGDIVIEVTPTNWLFSIIPVWKVLVAILRVPTTYAMSNRQWIALRITGDLSGSNNWYSTKWKLERGENVSPWTPNTEENEIDAQSNIVPQGHGGYGQITGGIPDRLGTIFGGPTGITIGEFVR